MREERGNGGLVCDCGGGFVSRDLLASWFRKDELAEVAFKGDVEIAADLLGGAV